MKKKIIMISLFSTLLNAATALPWIGPQQTGVPTSTANWSPAPTNSAKKNASLELRGIWPASVCGWIGGDQRMPAYCSTQSSCVWNSDYGIVGCCAITESNKCKFYTACVDMNSPKQTEDKDDVYTCKGTSVCYSNAYPLTYKQWGCGSSNWATFVATSFQGMGGPLTIVTTGKNNLDSSTITTDTSKPTQKVPTTGDSDSVTDNSSSLNLPSTLLSSVTSSVTQTNSPAVTSDSPPVSEPAKKTTHAGPIIAGSLGGVLALLFLASIGVVARRKGWFSHMGWARQKKDPDANFESDKFDGPPAPEPCPAIAHLDSGEIYEMGGGEEISGVYEKSDNGSAEKRLSVVSPMVSPLIASPPTTSYKANAGHWGQSAHATRSIRPVSELES